MLVISKQKKKSLYYLKIQVTDNLCLIWIPLPRTGLNCCVQFRVGTGKSATKVILQHLKMNNNYIAYNNKFIKK